MNFREFLTVGGVRQKLVESDVALEMSNSGRARFRVVSNTRPAGLVVYQCGYGGYALYNFFMGYIVAATQGVGGTWEVTCRELIEALTKTAYISLRHCLITDVLKDLGASTLLQFADIRPGEKAPRFASHADGYHAVRSLARVFNISDFCFYQQRDGKVWVGSWADSAYSRSDQKINPAFFTRQLPSGAVLPALPALRPGMTVNGRRIGSVRLTQRHETMVTWSN